MCDEFTAEAEAVNLGRRGISRRQFAALGAGVALVGCGGAIPPDGGSELSERMVSITTADGVCDAFFVHPAKGAHPGVIVWPDIAGLREAFRVMARSLAAQGHAVLVVNPYYRSAPAPVMESFAEYRAPGGPEKVAPMREALTPEAVVRDAEALVAFLDGREEVDKTRGIGSSGYCMGGPFTVRAAAAVPGRVRAAASFHGGGLVTDAPDSPHRQFGQTQASFLVAIARNDDARTSGEKAVLRKAADAAGRPAEIEVYDADHGWCVPDSPAYDPGEADRAWQRQLALFAEL